MAKATITDAIEHYWAFHDWMTGRNERAVVIELREKRKAAAQKKASQPYVKRVRLKPIDPNFDVWAWKARKEAKNV